MISIHALREEGDGKAAPIVSSVCNFYPRPPRGGRHDDDFFARFTRKISIHALREEGDKLEKVYTKEEPRISIHALREEGDEVLHCQPGDILISIHALREEGDDGRAERNDGSMNFYPRPPRGGRPRRSPTASSPSKFLSTPSARRATAKRTPKNGSSGYFYPRPPRGGRRSPSPALCTPSLFLSTPSARRATRSVTFAVSWYRFLSTPSARRATGGTVAAHTAHEDFYPRPPRGGRLFFGVACFLI